MLGDDALMLALGDNAHALALGDDAHALALGDDAHLLALRDDALMLGSEALSSATHWETKLRSCFTSVISAKILK